MAWFLLINTVVLYLAVCQAGEHTHTSDGEPDVLYVVGVSTPYCPRGKFYMLYIVGVRSLIPFQEATFVVLHAVCHGFGYSHSFF